MHAFTLPGSLPWKHTSLKLFEERLLLRTVAESFGYAKGTCRVEGVACLSRNLSILDVVLLHSDEEGLEGESALGNLSSKSLSEVKMPRPTF